jgi:hypothetical protein
MFNDRIFNTVSSQKPSYVNPSSLLPIPHVHLSPRYSDLQASLLLPQINRRSPHPPNPFLKNTTSTSFSAVLLILSPSALLFPLTSSITASFLLSISFLASTYGLYTLTSTLCDLPNLANFSTRNVSLRCIHTIHTYGT